MYNSACRIQPINLTILFCHKTPGQYNTVPTNAPTEPTFMSAANTGLIKPLGLPESPRAWTVCPEELKKLAQREETGTPVKVVSATGEKRDM
ncbi:hypothetical protein DDE82_001192 [Stemphylium lycopersici]|nr:hypothetical protein TW65_06224 [Stemphylium lycopersici]RAR10383.1 hypothetical protein DDE82_001192 [Stemphylium lycopersici]